MKNLNPRGLAATVALGALVVGTPLVIRAQNNGAAQVAPAADPAMALVGKPAPAFSLPDQNDKPRTLAASKGKWVVLAFYPADKTTGCTYQNKSYSNNIDKFKPLNAVVYTVSTQDTASKKSFCAESGLTHTLLSDVGGKVSESYGVAVSAGKMGKIAKRVTFYIAPDGTVAGVDPKINTNKAAEDSLAMLAKLQKEAPAKIAMGGAEMTMAFAGKEPVRLNSAVSNFSLPNATTGKSASFENLTAGKKASVVLFVSVQCPVSNAYNERMGQMATAYAAKGVQFIGVNANKSETPSAIAAHAKESGLSFPILKDAGNKVADQFDAKVTPEVFVTNAKGILVYHGPIDDSQDPSSVKTKYLASALDAVLAGKPVATASARAFGCGIKRERAL